MNINQAKEVAATHFRSTDAPWYDPVDAADACWDAAEVLAARVESLEAALRHYADLSNWGYDITGECRDIYMGDTNGYETAHKALMT